MTEPTTNDAQPGTGEPNTAETKRRRGAVWWWSGGVAAVLVALGGAAMILKPDWVFRRAAAKVETQRWDEAAVYPIEGVDGQGRKASFDVVVLSSDITWVRGSAEQLARKGAPIAIDQVATDVLRPEIRTGLARSATLIAVGAASSEGEVATETERAQRRARTTAKWLGEVTKPSGGVQLLNLGQFRANCGQAGEEIDTSFQRPFMTIGVRRQDAGTVIAEALADAMRGKSNLPSPECYTSFTMAKAE